jgi:hypothetical protein
LEVLYGCQEKEEEEDSLVLGVNTSQRLQPEGGKERKCKGHAIIFLSLFLTLYIWL